MELLVVFGAALAFYCATLAPTLIWGDSAWLALQALGGSLQFGTAGDHPFFVALGRVFTALPGDPARNLNFEAATFGALTVMLVYRCTRRLGGSPRAAAIGASALCVSHAFWLHAVIAEVYTANAFFLAAILNLLLEWNAVGHRRYLLMALAMFAVGLTNHLVLAAVAPAVIVFVGATDRRLLLNRRAAIMATAIVSLVVVTFAVAPGARAAVAKLWFGPPSIREYFQRSVDAGATAREAGYYLVFLAYQFPSFALPLGVVGIRELVYRDAKAAALLLMAVGVNAAVFIHHTGWQSPATSKFVFYIPDYVVFAIFVGIGTDRVLQRLDARSAPKRTAAPAFALLAAVAVWPPVLYATLPVIANRLDLDLVHARTLAYRDNQRFFLNPNKHGEYGPRRFAEEALQTALPGAIIFADYTPFAVLRYLQVVEHVRPDVLLGRARTVGETVPVRWVFDGQERRPTYLASWVPDYYDLTGLTGEYVVQPAGPIFELRPRR